MSCGSVQPCVCSFLKGSVLFSESCGVCFRAVGVLGAFLGLFESASKKASALSYYFLLKVTAVHDAGNENWRDPDSAYVSDGWRKRRWFSPTDARPLLKQGQIAVLDAFTTMPVHRRRDTRWRNPAGSTPRILLLNGPTALHDHCHGKGWHVLPAGSATPGIGSPLVASEVATSQGQKFAITAAAMWVADAVFLSTEECNDCNTDGKDSFSSMFYAGMAAGHGLPVLCVGSRDHNIGADGRVTCVTVDIATGARGDANERSKKQRRTESDVNSSWRHQVDAFVQGLGFVESM